ncbi:MAG TPA: 2-amino-4-hydroxy-6-hydroxymethyldihydropteridine diphosphokinase [Acidobacteriota bacterium]|nr:2-amino-4-hydroxy-6-hydroxymethyldihydropteridine diphosphokinase [Acidobacteriota bacterium]
MGRARLIPKGPRVIDLDILFYNDTICDEPDLKIPHLEIPHRRFVLAPMNDLAPNFVHPVLRKTISELLALCSDQSVVRRH